MSVGIEERLSIEEHKGFNGPCEQAHDEDGLQWTGGQVNPEGVINGSNNKKGTVVVWPEECTYTFC